MEDVAAPSEAPTLAMAEMTVGGSWQWSPTMTSLPFQGSFNRGINISGSVTCDASSITTRPNSCDRKSPEPAATQVAKTTSV
eukprot:CAMPEP_0171657008 /NCGR_PEP_ID=MMETSP0990-20121206/41970_1 /TAXON_ID=483369 /ORGANISM="non described non described, Strain CCMP2098" /LENGTH=81 /DNA_ID=CAMNT_0012237689 /DNA_START=366 /DNA_END=608 /DNA_ORIENTATION=-